MRLSETSNKCISTVCTLNCDFNAYTCIYMHPRFEICEFEASRALITDKVCLLADWQSRPRLVGDYRLFIEVATFPNVVLRDMVHHDLTVINETSRITPN